MVIMCEYGEIFRGKVEKPIVNFFVKRPVAFDMIRAWPYLLSLVTKPPPSYEWGGWGIQIHEALIPNVLPNLNLSLSKTRPVQLAPPSFHRTVCKTVLRETAE